MKEVRKSTQFKKDFKRIKNDVAIVKTLMRIVCHLERDEPIPPEYSPHMLKGQFRGIMECHIESDCLLMWIDEEHDVVRLLRIGSHSELLGM